MYHHFDILSERMRDYRRFNATGTQITVRLRPPADSEPTAVSPDLLPTDTESSNLAIDNGSPVSDPPTSPFDDTNDPPEIPNSSTPPPTAANPVAHFLASVN